jgi:hypothetical protein
VRIFGFALLLLVTLTGGAGSRIGRNFSAAKMSEADSTGFLLLYSVVIMGAGITARWFLSRRAKAAEHGTSAEWDSANL